MQAIIIYFSIVALWMVVTVVDISIHGFSFNWILISLMIVWLLPPILVASWFLIRPSLVRARILPPCN